MFSAVRRWPAGGFYTIHLLTQQHICAIKHSNKARTLPPSVAALMPCQVTTMLANTQCALPPRILHNPNSGVAVKIQVLLTRWFVNRAARTVDNITPLRSSRLLMLNNTPPAISILLYFSLQVSRQAFHQSAHLLDPFEELQVAIYKCSP